ncbi:hypothetical protein FQN51_003072 [Onygenales sp. PD_10]|nr:hypothetical protein FQN51_003072 [Onygenales sp. PD_10]
MGQLGGLSPEGSIAIGVLVGLISTSLQAIGLTLQRKSHMLEDEKDPYDLRRPPYKRRRWQVGMFMFVVSNIVGSTIQITTLPLPVLSTLQASGLVFNTIFAALILGEPFTRHSIFGTVLVCIGAVLIATFGAIGEPAHTLDQLLALLGRRPFLVWMAGTAVVVAVTIMGARMLKVISTPGKARDWAMKYQLPHTPSHHPSHHGHSPRIKVFRGMMYGSVSGILSAHSLLVAKSAVELLVRTIIDRVNQFNRWQSWIILLGLVALALTQLYYMHSGLKLCSTSILYPYVFCIYNIIAILDGLIYFHQASRLPALHAGLIALGTIILLSGVLCLSWRLEVVAGHPPPAVPVGPTPTPLTPGLGLLEEQPTPPEYEYYDEETTVGERQPLLSPQEQQQKPPPSSHSKSPSLSRFSPKFRRSTNPSLETAEIWAELDDDDENLDPLPQPIHPQFASNTHKRHRSKGSSISFGSSSKPRRTSFGEADSNAASPSPINGHRERIRKPFRSGTWDSQRLRFLHRSDPARRVSSPLVVDHRPGQYGSATQRNVSGTAGTVPVSGSGDDGAGQCDSPDDDSQPHERRRLLGQESLSDPQPPPQSQPQSRSQFTGPLRWLGRWGRFGRGTSDGGPHPDR